MPILLREPSTQTERYLFFKTLPAVVAACSDKTVKVIRVVSEDLDSLKQAVDLYDDLKRNPTKIESSRSQLNTTFDGGYNQNRIMEHPENVQEQD